MKTITDQLFGYTGKGEAVHCIQLENKNGMIVNILSYGCVIQKILIPQGENVFQDVVLGYDDMEGYEAGSVFLGTFVGRFANRIKGSKFELNGQEYCLEPNDGKNHLHGSYTSRVFPYKIEGDKLVFEVNSPDGEEGYPGNLEGTVSYWLTDDNELFLDYKMCSDKDTVVNLTNHSYFNLNGQNGGNILQHTLYLDCDKFTEADEETLPTGEIRSVAGTPLDFTEPKQIGQNLFDGHEQIEKCGGYDHNLILRDQSEGMREFACVKGDLSGITMKAATTQPAVQFYCGIYLEGDKASYGKNQIRYPKYGGFCLETQHYPCSPNFPQFPTTVLGAGEEYHQVTCYQFLVSDSGGPWGPHTI